MGVRSPIDNGTIAELLAREAEGANETLKRAFKRAARAAFLWPQEAGEMLERGQSLTELTAVGPYLERQIRSWIEAPPDEIQPPEIRRNFLTLARARTCLAMHPEWQKQYHGDLQMHSNWSDGAASIMEMAEAGLERGYSYIGITDHSQGLKIAGGISEEDLERQAQEIHAINEQYRMQQKQFQVLRSLELNLNPQGEGDMGKKCLKSLDIVVGSFHSKLREKSDQTDRYIAALRNTNVHILGHPVGRIYNHRLGLIANWHRVCGCAAELDKALEVDAYPDRQDLSIELLLIAKQEGTRIAIDTDAHAPEQLAFVELGLAAALLAGIPQERIINFMSAEKLTAWAKAPRGRQRDKS